MKTGKRRYWIVLVTCGVLCLNAIEVVSQNKKTSRTDPAKDILETLHPKPKMKPAPHGLLLLPGYKHKGATDFEGNDSGQIWKKGGLRITYEMGFNEGQAVTPEKKKEYVDYVEKVVNGRTVRYALTKEGKFILTMPLNNNPNTSHAANFYTNVKTLEEAADLITMGLAFAQK